jgi:DNA-binding transcriptional regulator YdaS (Cro superfamily)
VLRSGTVTLTWSASADTGNGIARYEVLSDGAVLATTAANVRTATVTVPAGRHTVAVRSVDSAGVGRVSSTSVRYLIDPTAPAVSAVTSVFRAGTASSALPVTVSWRASDDASGVCRQIHAGVTSSPPLASSARSVPDAARVGPNQWSLTATDCAGNDTTASGSATAAVVQDGALRYTGTWSGLRSSAALGGTFRSTKVTGAKATAAVTARSLALVASRGAAQGSVRVYVDGRLVATVSLYSKTAAARQVVWTYAFGSAGRHTVTLVNAGVKGRPTVNVDALLTLT